jgi:hypothetical protein
MENSKACTKCGQVLPRRKPYFYKDARQGDGLRPDCADCSRSRVRAYSQKNSQANRDRVRNWRLSNPLKAKQVKRDYYVKNQESIRRKWKERYKANPEIFMVSKYKRRANENAVVHEPYTWKSVVAKWGSDCHLCGKPIDLNAPRWVAIPGWQKGLHLDHVIRISEGGEDTLANVKPSHGLCNMRKR